MYENNELRCLFLFIAIRIPHKLIIINPSYIDVRILWSVLLEYKMNAALIINE